MGKSFMADIEEIRQENTQYALFHINKNKELLNLYLDIKSKHYNNKDKSIKSLELANAWADKHKNTFGDLFQTELDLVRWNKVLKLL